MSKKNNSQDEKIEEMLHRALGRYQELLFQAANAKKDESLYGYQQRFFKTMQAGANTVRAAAQSVVQSYIPNVDEPLSALLQSFGARYGGEEIKLTTYVRMVDTLTTSVESYRQRIDEQIRERERQGKVTTVMDLQDIINRDLRNDDVTVVKYANGTKIPVDKYAAMLARTTRAETENLSMVQQALREGIDLVECDIVSPTCDSCAVYQGRVYSISGNDSRYPALYKTAFKSGYSIIHPNCRHSWSPYHTELYSEEEKRQALERSNRSWQPDGDGRRFQQTETLRTQYAAGQQKLRQWNAEILEYERMKAHYKGIGEEPPYSTLGAFRRAKRAETMEYKEKRKTWIMQETVENSLTNWKLSGKMGKEPNPNAKTDCAVFWKIVNTKTHKDELAVLLGEKKVCIAVSKIETEVLKHREGTEYEDLYLIDARTGKIVARNISSTELLKVAKTEEMSHILKVDEKKDYVLIHNHPYSSPPSTADFNSLFKNPKIKYGVVIGHNGTVYKYTAPCTEIADDDLGLLIKHYGDLKYSQLTAEEKAYKVLMKKYKFTMEVLNKNE